MVELNGAELTEHEAELYDRQIRLWGLESQKRLRASKILICGLNGLGAEITKNIVLAGVKSVVLLDHRNVTQADNFAQFFIPVTDIGKNRCEASLQRVRALNPTVEITADTDDLSQKDAEFFCKFDVVVVTEAKTEEILRIDELCRKNNIKFFSGDLWGMFGYGFTDLQKHDFIVDKTKFKVISKPGDDKIKTEQVTSTCKDEITFPGFDVLLKFDFKTPEYLKRIKKTGPSFILLRILQHFRDRFGRDPHYETRNDDIQKLIEIRNEIAAENLIDENSFVHVFNQISPAAAIVGGEIAQEIIKTVSQKEKPHKNVFLFDPNTCCGYIETIE